MPTYVYGCDLDKTHARVEIVHGVDEFINLDCPDCQSSMHRIPQQLLSFGRPAIYTLIEWSTYNLGLLRSGTKRRFSPDTVNRVDTPIPQTKFKRSKKNG